MLSVYTVLLAKTQSRRGIDLLHVALLYVPCDGAVVGLSSFSPGARLVVPDGGQIPGAT